MTSSASKPQSVPVADRLMAWVDDVQLSARVGFPTYANTAELKADIRSLVEQHEKLRTAVEAYLSVPSGPGEWTAEEQVARQRLSEAHRG